MPKLTQSLINKTAPGKKLIVLRCSELPGFLCKITPAGNKNLYIRHRLGTGADAPVREPRIPVDLNKPGGVEEARRIARDWKAQGADGIDVTRARREAAQLPTVADLVERYREEHVPTLRPSNQRDTERRLRTKLPKSLLRVFVKDVTRADMDELHRKVRDEAARRRKNSNGNTEANRMLSLMSHMLNFAIQREWRDQNTNPCATIKHFTEKKRETYLNRDQLTNLFAALEDHESRVYRAGEAQDAADAIRLLLLTGCRSGELLGASWDQFDLDQAVWTKPSAHTKQKKEHKVSLSAPAIEVIEGIRARRGEFPGRWVFPGVDGKPRGSLKKAWDEIKVAADIEHVKLHDLRHSAASLMLEAGLSLPQIGKVLGHTQTRTTERYAHLTDDAGRAAAAKLGEIVSLSKRKDGS